MTNKTIAILGPTQDQKDKLQYLESLGLEIESFSVDNGKCFAYFEDDYSYEIDLDDFDITDEIQKIYQKADIYSCCGDILDRDIMMCPTCKEHC
jgi:hypothetical protein